MNKVDVDKALATLRRADVELTASRTPDPASRLALVDGERRRRLPLRAWSPAFFEDFEPDFWPTVRQR